MQFNWQSALIFASIAAFIFIRWRIQGKSFKRGEATKMAILGAGFPPAVVVCLSAFDKRLLDLVVDTPTYLSPMGFIMVLYSIGDLFDWDT